MDSWTAHCNWHRARQIDIKQVVIRYLIDARLVNLQLQRVNGSQRFGMLAWTGDGDGDR